MRPERSSTLQALLLRIFLPAVSVSAILLAALVYNMLHENILRQFDERLIATSAIVGVMIDPADHDGLIAAVRAGADPATLEADPRYRRNVEPMRRILETLGLTYLYTQVLGGPEDVLYILDGTDGEDHTPIGAPDSMTAETMAGLRAISSDQGVYVSPVEYQEQWGLLKTAAAPVYRTDGRVAGTAGADVNVTVLQVATQAILFQSALIGLGSIILCLFATLFILRRVATPIERLTQEALRIAAGDYRPPADIRGPREVRSLRASLALLRDHAMQDLHRAEADMAEHRRAESARHVLTEHKQDSAVITLADRPDQLLLWVATGGGGLDALFTLEALRGAAQRMDGEQAGELLCLLAKEDQGVLLRFECAARRLTLLGSTPIMLMVGGAEQRLAPRENLVLGAKVADIRYRGVTLPLEASR